MTTKVVKIKIKVGLGNVHGHQVSWGVGWNSKQRQHLVIKDLDVGKVAKKDKIACCNI